ncbi:hypothetical protein FRC05_001901 [Tulasnella sp. 425]|nr:hypothetical protein FRC05_001901 [Tulasnella sp. 425]
MLDDEHLGGSGEGKSDEDPIALGSITTFEMESFVDVLDARIFDKEGKREWKQLAAALHLSTMWEFEQVRARLIKDMSLIIDNGGIDPLDRIEVSIQCRVSDWLYPAYQELCDRTEPLTTEEAKRLGMDRLAAVYRVDSTVYSIPLRLASQHLVDLTKAADPNKPLGGSLDDPLPLKQVSRHEMESFLKVMNASWIDGKPGLGGVSWARALYAATTLEFQPCRTRIIAELEHTVRKLDALPMFELAVRCQVGEWRSWAFQKLCERSESLNADEGRILGVEITMTICGIREKLARRARSPCQGIGSGPNWWPMKNVLGCTCVACSYVLALIKAEKPLTLDN